MLHGFMFVLYLLWIPILGFVLTLISLLLLFKNKIENLVFRALFCIALSTLICFVLLGFLVDLQETYLRHSGFRWQ